MHCNSKKPRVARRAEVIARGLARLIVLFLFAALPVLAQLRSLDVSQYLHTSWTAQDGYFRGLRISGKAMAQTADGYIWIVGTTGLLRFDGVRFVEWNPPNSESLPGRTFSGLLASRDGSLWIPGNGPCRTQSRWHMAPIQ